LVEKIDTSFVTKGFIEENLEDLLKWNFVDIIGDNGITKKVQLDLDYVFYLLWECANESIWINLKWVKILDKVITEHEEDTPGRYEDDRWRVEWGSTKISINNTTEYLSGGIYANTVESKNELAWAKKWSAGVKMAAAKAKWAESEPNDEPWSTPWDNDNPWTGPWENPNLNSWVWENGDSWGDWWNGSI
jgi:hypothetical protein